MSPFAERYASPLYMLYLGIDYPDMGPGQNTSEPGSGNCLRATKPNPNSTDLLRPFNGYAPNCFAELLCARCEKLAIKTSNGIASPW